MTSRQSGKDTTRLARNRATSGSRSRGPGLVNWLRWSPSHSAEREQLTPCRPLVPSTILAQPLLAAG